MPSSQRSRRTVAFVWLLPAVAIAGTARADIDLTGRWRTGPDAYVEIVQSGTDVTVTGPSGTLVGTFDQEILRAPDVTVPNLVLQPYGNGSILDGVTHVDGSPEFVHARYTRCECFDGNSVDGDGCSSECRVEPCFTCTPEPSVCAPAAESAPCDDENDCTTGETCSSGACGNGSAISACVNLTGTWRVNTEDPESGSRRQYDRTYTQRDGAVFSATEIGSIDPISGELTLHDVGGFMCTLSMAVSGTAALDNLEFSATGSTYSTSRFFCYASPLVLHANRCDAAGCDLADCSGKADGTPCNTGPCRVEELCQAEVCASESKCPACETCSGGEGPCQMAPRPDCLATTDADSSRLLFVDKADDSRDKIQWSWVRGEAFDADVRGPTAADDLSLCVFFDYGDSGIYATRLSPGTACAKEPCWNGRDGNYRYRNDASLSPITSLSVKSGEAGRARIQLRGRGEKLGESGPVPNFGDFPLTERLVTQLQSDSGACFEAEFDPSGVTRSVDGLFKANGGKLE